MHNNLSKIPEYEEEKPTTQVNSCYSEIDRCRLCQSQFLEVVIPLPALSIASPNVGGEVEKSGVTAPVDVCQCKNCGFLQLPVVINPEYQYKKFLYKTDISLGLKEHFAGLLDQLEKMGVFKKGISLFDVGSNDGSLLALAKKYGANVLGIDPATDIAKKATEEGIPTYGDFFSASKAREILQKHGKMNIIISNNTLANIDNLRDIFAGFHLLLDDKGVVVIETQYALDVLEKKLLDVIYHEHISYFAVKPMSAFLKSLGFELIDAVRIAPKGGSIRLIIQKANGPWPVQANVSLLIQKEIEKGLYSSDLFKDFNEYVKCKREHLKAHLKQIKNRTGHAFAYGASVGCFALLHFLHLHDIIEKVFDDTPLCSHLNVQNVRIPVEQGAHLLKSPITSVAVLAWRYIDTIARKQKKYSEQGGVFFSVL